MSTYRDDLTAAIAAREAETKRADEAEASIAELKAKQPFHWWIGIPLGCIATCVMIISTLARIPPRTETPAQLCWNCGTVDAAAPSPLIDSSPSVEHRTLSFYPEIYFERHFEVGNLDRTPAPQLSAEVKLEVLSLNWQQTQAMQMADAYQRALKSDARDAPRARKYLAFDRAEAERYDKEEKAIHQRLMEIVRRECGGDDPNMVIENVPVLGGPDRLEIRCEDWP